MVEDFLEGMVEGEGERGERMGGEVGGSWCGHLALSACFMHFKRFLE